MRFLEEKQGKGYKNNTRTDSTKIAPALQKYNDGRKKKYIYCGKPYSTNAYSLFEYYRLLVLLLKHQLSSEKHQITEFFVILLCLFHFQLSLLHFLCMPKFHSCHSLCSDEPKLCTTFRQATKDNAMECRIYFLIDANHKFPQFKSKTFK